MPYPTPHYEKLIATLNSDKLPDDDKPRVVVPNGFTAAGTPPSITFTGRLYDEATVLAVARAYQQATELAPALPAPMHMV